MLKNSVFSALIEAGNELFPDAAICPCRVIDIKGPEKIKAAEPEGRDIKRSERVLFKTRNSRNMEW